MKFICLDGDIVNTEHILCIRDRSDGGANVYLSNCNLYVPEVTAAQLAMQILDPDCLVKSVIDDLVNQNIQIAAKLQGAMDLISEVRAQIQELNDRKLLLEHELEAIKPSSKG